MKKKSISEATGTGSSGSFKMPINFAPLNWGEEPLEPFNIPVSKYMNPTLAHDSYDGSLDISKKKAAKIEKLTRRLSRKASDSFTQNDPDGNPLNGFIPMGVSSEGTPGSHKRLYKEATENSVNSGEYNVPLSTGKRPWKKTILSPFDFEVDQPNAKETKLNDLISHHVKKIEKEKINEDLRVWFGTKKKPKGSSQPKGPWVNICRKKEGGGHPPCGRPEAGSKGYPKCRAAGVASKMTDAQKKAACSQKRRAEKTNPKSGTGNKPKMVSYKPRKESTEQIIRRVIKEYFSQQD